MLLFEFSIFSKLCRHDKHCELRLPLRYGPSRYRGLSLTLIKHQNKPVSFFSAPITCRCSEMQFGLVGELKSHNKHEKLNKKKNRTRGQSNQNCVNGGKVLNLGSNHHLKCHCRALNWHCLLNNTQVLVVQMWHK